MQTKNNLRPRARPRRLGVEVKMSKKGLVDAMHIVGGSVTMNIVVWGFSYLVTWSVMG